jgi:KRAB domain-containing zinc finger protein
MEEEGLIYRKRLSGDHQLVVPKPWVSEVTAKQAPLNKKHICGVCNSAFLRLWDLRRHEVTDANDRPHMCSQCNETFKIKSYLVRHMHRHNGKPAYVCEVCSKTFTRRDNLIRHSL